MSEIGFPWSTGMVERSRRSAPVPPWRRRVLRWACRLGKRGFIQRGS